MHRSIPLIAFGLIVGTQVGCAVSLAQEPADDPEPRVEPVPVAEMTTEQKELLGIEDGKPLPRRATTNLFRTLAHNPDLMSVYFPLGDAVNRAPQFPDKPRELLIMRVAWLYQSEYEWAQHREPALRSGWTPEDLERIKAGPDAPGWTQDQRTILKAADQLVSNAYLDDDVWQALSSQYSAQDIMVLMTVVTHYHWVAMMTKTLGIELEEGKQGFLNKSAVDESSALKYEGFVAFVEGPAWRSDGTVLFTDVPNNRILRRDVGGRISLHRSPSGHANGMFVDHEDRLLIAESEGRIIRENIDGSVDVLAAEYDGKAFNSPNDLALDTKGRIYFTDPAGLNRADPPQKDENGSTVNGVYRIDPSGRVTRLLTHEIDRPNGILVSPGDQYLYIADNDPRAGGARKVWRFDLDDSGNIDIKSRALMFDWGTERGPDGMTVDQSGNIYVASGLNHPMPNRTSRIYKAGIYVISPTGELKDFIAVPMDNVSNVTFGGEDLQTLYITAGHSLWSYRVDTPGYKPF